MDQVPTPFEDNRAFPMGLIVVPAFVGTLLWLIAMLNRLAQQ